MVELAYSVMATIGMPSWLLVGDEFHAPYLDAICPLSVTSWCIGIWIGRRMKSLQLSSRAIHILARIDVSKIRYREGSSTM